MKRRNPSEYVGIEGRIILQLNYQEGCGCMDWVHLAQDRVNGGLL